MQEIVKELVIRVVVVVVVDFVSDWLGAVVTALKRLPEVPLPFYSPAHMKDGDDHKHSSWRTGCRIAHNSNKLISSL